MAKKHFLPSDDELEQPTDINSVNARNEQEFQNLMDHNQRKYDNYWDINSPVVRIVLIVLLLIIVVGTLYYIILWFR